MKTRTLCSLVFRIAAVATLSFTSAFAGASGNSPEQASSASSSTNAAAVMSLPSPPETAAITVLPQPLTTSAPALSGWGGEFVKLAQAGLEPNVLLSFVDTAGTFNLTADQIIYLHDIGVPAEVITSMIQHDAEIAAGLREPGAGAPTAPALVFPPLPSSNDAAPLMADDFASLPDSGPLENFYLPVFPENQSGDKPELSPVRKPYPVELTSPILVIRTQGRIPNVVLLHSLP